MPVNEYDADVDDRWFDPSGIDPSNKARAVVNNLLSDLSFERRKAVYAAIHDAMQEWGLRMSDSALDSMRE